MPQGFRATTTIRPGRKCAVQTVAQTATSSAYRSLTIGFGCAMVIFGAGSKPINTSVRHGRAGGHDECLHNRRMQPEATKYLFPKELTCVWSVCLKAERHARQLFFLTLKPPIRHHTTPLKAKPSSRRYFDLHRQVPIHEARRHPGGLFDNVDTRVPLHKLLPEDFKL